MREMDQPRRLRPLSDWGLDSAATEVPGVARHIDQSGAARPPAELLDELRLRLSSLPGNHPSSTRGAGQDRTGAERTAPDLAGADVAREPLPGDHTQAAGDRAGTVLPGREGDLDASVWARFQWPDALTAEVPFGWREGTEV